MMYQWALHQCQIRGSGTLITSQWVVRLVDERAAADQRIRSLGPRQSHMTVRSPLQCQERWEPWEQGQRHRSSLLKHGRMVREHDASAQCSK